MFTKVLVCGLLGKNIEVMNTRSGEIIKLSVGVPKYNDKKVTDWYTCTVWTNLVEYVKQLNLNIGDKLFISGRLELEIYNNSIARKIHVETIDILSKKKSDGDVLIARQRVSEVKNVMVTDDDLPF